MPFDVTTLQNMQSAFLEAGDATFTKIMKGSFNGHEVEFSPEDQIRVNKDFVGNLLSEIKDGISSLDSEQDRKARTAIENHAFFSTSIDHPLSGREIAKVVGDCIELIQQANDLEKHIPVPSNADLQKDALITLPWLLEHPLSKGVEFRLNVSGLRAQIEKLNLQIDAGKLTKSQASSMAEQLKTDFVRTKADCINLVDTLNFHPEFRDFFLSDILGNRALKPGKEGFEQYKAMLSSLTGLNTKPIVDLANNHDATADKIAEALLVFADSLNGKYNEIMKAVGDESCADFCRTTMCRTIFSGNGENNDKIREALGRITSDKKVEVLNYLFKKIENADQKARDVVNFAGEFLNLADDMALLPKQIKQAPYNKWDTEYSVKTLDCSKSKGALGTDEWIDSIKTGVIVHISKENLRDRLSEILLPERNAGLKPLDDKAEKEVKQYYNFHIPGKLHKDDSYFVAPRYKSSKKHPLSPEDVKLDLLHTYTADSKNVNGAMWTSTYKKDSNFTVNSKTYSVNDVNEAQEIDSYLSAHRTKSPLRVFAGMTGNYLKSNFYTDKDGNLKFRGKAFQSTSRSPVTALNFSRHPDGGKFHPVIVFDIPPNFPAVALGEISEYGDGEQELLLNQGLSGTVQAVQTGHVGGKDVAFFFVRLDPR